MATFDAIDAMAFSHAAWKNSFFESAKLGLSIQDLRKVCPEYYFFTNSFPEILSQLIARVDDGTRFLLVAILYSEQGSGVESHAHANLFRYLCLDLGISDKALNSAPKLKETRELVSGLRKLYSKSPVLESLGAQYALEFQADNMLRSFRPAFATIDGQLSHQPTEVMRFFDVHETEEPQHIFTMKRALVRDFRQDADLQLVTAGARKCLDLFAAFWLALSRLIDQP